MIIVQLAVTIPVNF